MARSFGPPAVTAECAIGFLRPGGEILVSEPPEPDPDRWPADGLAGLGLVAETVPEAAPAHLVRSAGQRASGSEVAPTGRGPPQAPPLVAASDDRWPRFAFRRSGDVPRGTRIVGRTGIGPAVARLDRSSPSVLGQRPGRSRSPVPSWRLRPGLLRERGRGRAIPALDATDTAPTPAEGPLDLAAVRELDSRSTVRPRGIEAAKPAGGRGRHRPRKAPSRRAEDVPDADCSTWVAEALAGPDGGVPRGTRKPEVPRGTLGKASQRAALTYPADRRSTRFAGRQLAEEGPRPEEALERRPGGRVLRRAPRSQHPDSDDAADAARARGDPEPPPPAPERLPSRPRAAEPRRSTTMPRSRGGRRLKLRRASTAEPEPELKPEPERSARHRGPAEVIEDTGRAKPSRRSRGRARGRRGRSGPSGRARRSPTEPTSRRCLRADGARARGPGARDGQAPRGRRPRRTGSSR